MKEAHLALRETHSMLHASTGPQLQFQQCFDRFFPTARVLDVGCGAGDLTAEMARRVPLGSVLGVDHCYRTIVQAARRCPPDQYPNLRFATANARTLKLREEPFDFVVSRNCLHLVRVPGLTFPAIAKQLKPGGTMHVWFQGFGHCQEVTDTLFVLCTREHWKEYFAGFELQRYLMTPRFCEPWLNLSQLRPKQLEFARRTLDFPSTEIFVQWLQWAWPEYWKLVPAAHRPQFNEEFVELYPLKTGSTYQAHAVWLVVDAVKDHTIWPPTIL